MALSNEDLGAILNGMSSVDITREGAIEEIIDRLIKQADLQKEINDEHIRTIKLKQEEIQVAEQELERLKEEAALKKIDNTEERKKQRAIIREAQEKIKAAKQEKQSELESVQLRQRELKFAQLSNAEKSKRLKQWIEELKSQKQYTTDTAKLAELDKKIAEARLKQEQVREAKGKVTAFNMKQRTDEYRQAVKDLDEQLKNGNIDRDAYVEAKTEAAQEAGFASSKQADTVKALNSLLDTVKSIRGTLDSAVKQAATFQGQYMGKIDARLQSEEMQFGFYQGIVEDVQKEIGVSRFVSQQKLLERVGELVDRGVAYNVEQRAFLATVSDKMVTTFDALDSTLTSLVRLQQADLTASQLGSEALLTQFLNSQFEDTSFLSDAYDSVLSALTTALSSMDKDMATSFAYSVEKWLGSLYSVGLSGTAVSTIASGINMLASGNVRGLTSNQPLNTLFNMAATNAGLSYSEMLVNGLNASNVNDLMRSMVEYLASIAENTQENQVLRSEWSNVLGITLTDLRAASNLTTNDLSAIYNSSTTYAKSVAEVGKQLSVVPERTPASLEIQNMLNNLMFNWGTNIAKSSASYFMWEFSDILKDLVDNLGLSDVEILGVNVGGLVSGISGASALITGVPALAKVLGNELKLDELFDFGDIDGIGGVFKIIPKLITNAKGIVDAFKSGIESFGAASLTGFDWDTYTTRGQNYSGGILGVTPATATTSTSSGVVITGSTFGTTAPVIEGISSSAYIGSDATTSAISTLATNAENLATATMTVSGVSEAISKGAEDIYSELFEKQTKPIRVNIAELEKKSLGQLTGLVESMKPEDLLELISSIYNTMVEDNRDDANKMLQMIDLIRRQ